MRDKLGRFIKNYPSWNKGKKLSIIHRKNLSLGQQRRQHFPHTKETKRKIGIANSKPKIKIICQICKKEFWVNPCLSQKKFCSQKCYGLLLRKNDRKYFCIDCYKSFSHSHSSRQRCRKCFGKWLKANIHLTKNPLWKGGLSRKEGYRRNKLKEWRKKNPLSVKTHNLRRRTLQDDLTLQNIQETYENNIKKYGRLTCYLCLNPIPFGKDCLEHKIPLSRGGTNEKVNLAIAHRSCNNKKSTKTEQEYREVYR